MYASHTSHKFREKKFSFDFNFNFQLRYFGKFSRQTSVEMKRIDIILIKIQL